MKHFEENKGHNTTDENMLIATDNATALSSNPCLHPTNDIEEYSVHQLKNVGGDKFQAISTKPPTPNQGNTQINRYLVQYVIFYSNEYKISYFEIIQIYFRGT